MLPVINSLESSLSRVFFIHWFSTFPFYPRAKMIHSEEPSLSLVRVEGSSPCSKSVQLNKFMSIIAVIVIRCSWKGIFPS